MRLLQRYVVFELLRVFAFVVVVLTVLLVFVGAFGQMTENGLGPSEIAEILPFLVPSLLPFTIPATMLLTVTVVYGRLAADQEVTAVKAAGISAMSLLWPSFVMGAALSLISLLLTDQVIPWAFTNIEKRVAQMMEKIFLDALRSRKLFVDADQGIRITTSDVIGNRLIGPVFRYAPKGRDPLTISAHESLLHFDLEKEVVLLELVRANIGGPGGQMVVDRKEFSFPLPRQLKKTNPRHRSIHDNRRKLIGMTDEIDKHRSQRDVETAFALASGGFERLSHVEVLQYSLDVENHKSDIARLRMEIHSRFALSSSCLFFSLLGAPFAILQARRQFLTSFFICFVPILLLYYPLTMLMMNQSKTGNVNPAWAVWIGNAVVLCVAAIPLRRVLQH